jgi:hypothetical protein
MKASDINAWICLCGAPVAKWKSYLSFVIMAGKLAVRIKIS